MGPPESPTNPLQNQATTSRRPRRGPRRRPRRRYCLLKGCQQRFRPQRARQRYCSDRCREAARRWSLWKAQHRYRRTSAGQQKRNGQSRRYRERVGDPKTSGAEAVAGAARVITKIFFSIISVTGRDVTRGSYSAGDPPASASARRSADTPWSVSGNGSGVGRRRGQTRKASQGARCPGEGSAHRARPRDRSHVLTAG